MDDSELDRVGPSRLAGLPNLLGKELGLWLGTSRWWRHCLGWVILINGSVALLPLVMSRAGLHSDPYAAALEAHFSMSGLALTIAAIVMMQDAMISERERGTMAWLLSHPIARLSVVVSKLVGGACGLIATGVLVPALVTYGQMSWVVGQQPPAGFYGLAVGLLALQVLFYVSFMLLLGTLLHSRVAAIGVALIFVFAGGALPAVAPWLSLLLPWQLDRVALVLVLERGLPSLLLWPVAAAAAWSVVLAVLAAVRFQSLEI